MKPPIYRHLHVPRAPHTRTPGGAVPAACGRLVHDAYRTRRLDQVTCPKCRTIADRAVEVTP